MEFAGRLTLHIRVSQEEREIEAMTDKELQRLERDTLDELGGVMYRAALLRTGMTDNEYLKQGGQQLIYEQLFGAVASLCISGYTPDDIVPALIRHAVELAVMDCDDRDEACQLLTKSMDKYLALEGLQRKSASVLRLVRRDDDSRTSRDT
jgi:hypothetical protein